MAPIAAQGGASRQPGEDDGLRRLVDAQHVHAHLYSEMPQEDDTAHLRAQLVRAVEARAKRYQLDSVVHHLINFGKARMHVIQPEIIFLIGLPYTLYYIGLTLRILTLSL